MAAPSKAPAAPTKMAAVDPLEAVSTPAPAPGDNFDPPTPVAPVTPLPETQPEPVLPAPGAVVAPKTAPQYEVLRTITVSWGPQMLRLVSGDIVSDELHGDGAIEKMRQAGVALQEKV